MDKVDTVKVKKTRNCEVCFKIVCAQCGWEPTGLQVLLIQKKLLTQCPICDWKPGTPASRL